jgi:hypothetical protein
MLAVVAMVAALMFASSSPAGAAPPHGTFHPVTPTRIVDTRSGIGVAAGAVPGDGTIDFQVAGFGGVPAGTAAGSVVLNLTAVDPTSEGYLNVYPRGFPKPTPANPSSLNFRAGQNVANAVTVTLSDDGGLTVYNAFGNTHVLVDVVGWYDETGTGGGRYNPLTPARIMDSRSGLAKAGAFGPNEVANLTVTGVGGVPSSGVSGVVLNLTATDTTSQSFLTVYPQAGTRPEVSNLNFVAGQTRANLVTVGINTSNGQISIYNAFGNAHVIVDVVGWYDSAGTTGLLYHGITPTRIADTRPVNAPLRALEPASLPLRGIAGIPNDASAVVTNITATDPTSEGYLTVFPTGQPLPNASNLNWPGPGNTVPNAVVTSLGTGGEVTLFSPFGEVHILIDVFGYFSAT